MLRRNDGIHPLNYTVSHLRRPQSYNMFRCRFRGNGKSLNSLEHEFESHIYQYDGKINIIMR
jgi:hypothetical protein